MRQYRWFLLGLFALTSACSETSSATGPNLELAACDPLVAAEAPISLGSLIAVGQDSAGTFYVVDEFEGDHRVFRSSGTELVRLRVSGSGSVTGDKSELRHFSYESSLDDGATGIVAVFIDDGTVRMAIAPNLAGKGDFEAIVAAGEELLILDESSLKGLDVRNLPGYVVVEYNATTQDGGRIVVTRPLDDWTYDDFRVFYGKESQLSERLVLDVLRARDGGTTTIRFDVGESEVTVLFPASLTGTADAPTWTEGGVVTELTKLAATDGLDGLSFECFEGG